MPCHSDNPVRVPFIQNLNHPGERIVEFPGVIFMSRTVRVVIIDVLSSTNAQRTKPGQAEAGSSSLDGIMPY